MTPSNALGAAAGVLADRLLGEPGRRWHPVGRFGAVMDHVEKRGYRDSRLAGTWYAAAGLALGAAAGAAIRSTSLASYVAVAGRELGKVALAVQSALDDRDLDRARSLLPALVGRDPSALDEKGVARAAVESVAENTVDAIVAPALWALVAGAPGALAYRAVNTLDAMVGHHSPRYERFGWASARLDDAAGFVPARVTVVLVAAARPSRATDVWRTVRADAAAHPSPNAGVAEAAFAAALGLRLGGVSRYGGRVELRPPLGAGRPPEARDIVAAVRLAGDVALLTAAGLAGLAALRVGRRTRR